MLKLMAGALLILSGFSGFAFGKDVIKQVSPIAAAPSVAVSSNSVVWPDYSKWPVLQKAPYHIVVANDGAYFPPNVINFEVEVGEITVYVDDFKKPFLAVAEVDILKNGPVLRNALILTPAGAISKDIQMLVNGKWVSVKNGSLQVQLDSARRLFCNYDEKTMDVLLAVVPVSGDSPVWVRVSGPIPDKANNK